jgi:hypothetical protein
MKSTRVYLLLPALVLSQCGVLSLKAAVPKRNSASTTATPAAIAFPTVQSARAGFVKPMAGERLEVTPPGFAWWRAGGSDQVTYRLRIRDAGGKVVHESPALKDPVYCPDRALAPGAYTFEVEAMDAAGVVRASRPPQAFTIAPGAYELPFVPAADLLARVPREHPRLLFPKATLGEVRATLTTTRRAAFESLRKGAAAGLRLGVPSEPTYDKLPTKAEQKLGYFESFGRMRKYHDEGMRHCALLYALTGERKYGEKARDILLGAAEWDPEGISSVMSPFGDEIGLGLAKAAAETYDWIYDLLTEPERVKARRMLIARGDQMLRRLTRSDYLASPAESHNGRLPGFLAEYAIALAEEPAAVVWMDYAMQAFLTVYPHWGGWDGGWAEGVSYGLAYNSMYLTPLEAIRRATGIDVWQRSFYRKIGYFFLHNISPVGDISPWGDSEAAPSAPKVGSVKSLLQFYANRFNDTTLAWWANRLKTSAGEEAGVSAFPGIWLADEVKPIAPPTLPNDRAFYGIGWATLHSDILQPERDTMVMFKCSPYGGVSHSHADQASFAIMKGGRSLAIPGGERYPQHGSPFHVEYTQQTLAHNAVLIDGVGQIGRDARYGGTLSDFQSTERFGYACGDATQCYGPRATRNRRHLLLVRPGVVIAVDDLATPAPASFQWLLHAHNQFTLDESAQRLVSRKADATMTVDLLTADGFSFRQTNQWPVDPKKGFPTVKASPPEAQWHFTADTRTKAAARRILAVMSIADEKGRFDCRLERAGDLVIIRISSAGASEVETVVRVDLSTRAVGQAPIIEADHAPSGAPAEKIRAF